MQQQKPLLIAVVIILVVAAGAWFYFSKYPATERQDGTTQEVSEVVARVNGTEITRADLEAAEAEIALEQGIADIASLDTETRTQLQTQAIDRLIARTLIQQAAAEAGIAATDEEINTEIDAIKAQFADDAAYQAALTEQGGTEEELRAQIAINVATRKYFEQALDLESITVTDEEIQAEYDQASITQKGLPELEQLRDQIEAFIIQRKQQELLNVHVEELRANAEIEMLI